MAKLPPDKRKAWAAFLLGHRYPGHISLRAESYDEGLACSARACELDDEDKGLHWERLQFESLTGKHQTLLFTGNPDGKLRLVPDFGEGSGERLARFLDEELERGASAINPGNSNTEEPPHLRNEAYDELLSRNIVFIQLYDASANNTVIEYLVRPTPLLVKPLSAVVEYLGPEYSFYYTDLEAAPLVMDLDRVRDTHNYLLERPLRAKLTGEHFQQNFVDSDVYALLEQSV